MSMLLITNDYPPRAGGIQQYCYNLVRGLPPGEVVVYAPAWPGAAEFDAGEAYRIVRHPTSMLPTASVARRAIDLIREVRPDVVCFGAAFPLGLRARRRPGVRVRLEAGAPQGPGPADRGVAPGGCRGAGRAPADRRARPLPAKAGPDGRLQPRRRAHAL